MLSLLWNVSRRELAARPVRVALFVAAIAIGVAMMTAMRVATDTVVDEFQQRVDRSAGRADLQVTFGTGESGFPEETLDVIRRQPFVARAAALVRGALYSLDHDGEVFELFGVDVLQDSVLDLYDVEVLEREPDDFTILNDPYGLFVTETLAREFECRLGTKISLMSVDGVHEFTVRGVIDAGGLAAPYDGRVVAMYLPASQPVAGRRFGPRVSFVDQIDVELIDGVVVSAAAADLQKLLPPELVVASPAQRRLLAERTVDGLRAALVGISALGLIAATFIVYATTASLVAYRLPEMGTLISVGARPSDLVRLILAEATILGAIASILGVGVGSVLATFVAGDVAAGMSLNYAVDFGDLVGGSVGGGALSGYVLIGTVAALVAAWVPSRRLLEVDPLAARNPFPPSERGTSLARVTLAGAFLLLAGAVAVAVGTRQQSSAWCTAGGIAIVCGGVFVARPAMQSVWRRLAERLRSSADLAMLIAAENLVRSARRAMVTCCAVAMCIAVAVAAASIAHSFRLSVAHWYGFSGDAIVAARNVRGGWLNAPVSERVAGDLLNLGAVAGVETLRVLQGQRFRDSRVAVVGLSEGYLANVQRALPDGVRPRAATMLASGAGVLVSDNFALHFGVREGEVLELATPSGHVEAEVVGVVPDYVSDQGSVLMLRSVFSSRWRDSLVNYVAVELIPTARVSDLRSAVAALPERRFELSVISSAAMRDRVDSLIDRAFADVDTIQLLVILITLAGIVDLLLSNVLDRSRETGLLRVVGANRRLLMAAATWEAAAIGLTAGILGVVVGALASWVWVTFNYPVLVGYVLQFHFSWAAASFCILLATLTAASTAAWATGRSAMRPLTEALRFE